MLPKPEKNRKGIQNAEQLSLDTPIKKEVNLKQKRTFVAISIIISIFLCISFSLYHQIKNNGFKVNVPNIKNSVSSSPDRIEKDINSILDSEKNVWSIYAKDYSSGSEINWSQNQSSFIIDKDKILSQKNDLEKVSTNSGLLNNVLPGGVKYTDNRQNLNGDLIYATLLSIPQKNILIYIKISSGASLDQDHLNLKISQVSEKIYWSLVNP